VSRRHFRNGGSEAHLDRLLRYADPVNPNVLTIGFRAPLCYLQAPALLFEDLDWLRRIFGDEKRPVLFIFAGKAHPADVPGRISSAGSRRWRTCRTRGQNPVDRRLRPAAGAAAGFRGRRVAEQPVYPLEASAPPA